MKTINISASSTTCTIDIEGTIGVKEQGGGISTYQQLREQIEQIQLIDSPIVVVNIRSVGGDVNDAMLIYEALLSLDAHITTRCYGYTASAATIIAQAANEGCREIASSALYLIHNSHCSAQGNAEQLSAQVELLKKTDSRIAAIYAARSGRDKSHFAELMAANGGDGEWLSPEQAVEAGLVDTIITPDTSLTESLIGRISKWLGIKPDKEEQALPDDRVNVRGAQSVQHSVIALIEGQNMVSPTTIKAVEDPDIEGNSLSANAVAYNKDAAVFH